MLVTDLVTALQHMMKLEQPVTMVSRPYIRCDPVTGWATATDNPNWGKRPCIGFWHFDSKGDHLIVLSEEFSNDSDIVIATVAHEYVHAWQWETFKSGKRMHHGKRDYFVQWGDYIKQELGIGI